MLKQYSRALDMLIASVAAHRAGKLKLASKLYVKASETKGITEILATLDGWNSKAADTSDQKWKTMAKALVAASSKPAKKSVEKADDMDGEDLGLEDLDLEEGDLDVDGDDADIDEILDGLNDDSGEMAAEEEKKDDDEEAGEHNDVSKSPDEPEHLTEETPAPDRNQAAKVQAKAGNDKRVVAVAHNLKALARLLKS